MTRRLRSQKTIGEESSEFMKLGLKKGVLFHDINAGQPCFKCGDECPGFQLHFWRKNCLHCKCSPFSHESSEPAQQEKRVVGRLSLDKVQPFKEMLIQRQSFLSKTKPAIAQKPSKVFQGEMQVQKNAPPVPRKGKGMPGTQSDGTASSVHHAYEEHQLMGGVNTAVEEMHISGNVVHGKMQPRQSPSNAAVRPSHGTHAAYSTDGDTIQGGMHTVQEIGMQAQGNVQSSRAMAREYATNDASTTSSMASFSADGDTLQGTPSVASINETFHVAKLGELEVPALTAELPYAWTPEGLSSEEVVEFFAAPYPLQQVPVEGTDGERRFMMMMEEQLPTHDLNVEQCHDLSPGEVEEFEAFLELKSDNHEIGHVSRSKGDYPCFKCKKPVHTGTLQVTIDGVDGVRYHPACFSCDKCNELLAGLNVFLYEDLILCERHFADQYKPRCKACDESIVQEEVLEAEDATWHVKHFCCYHCDKPMLENPYVPMRGHPHCQSCFDNATVKLRAKFSVRKKGK